MNYGSKKREVKRLKKKVRRKDRKKSKVMGETSETKTDSESDKGAVEDAKTVESESPWEQHKPEEVKSRDEEMEDYLQDLLL